ncbi:DUF4405 domain-containing protein [Winogradskyella sp.]|uniref:DUF4405 domain-containing protein n=1 Tax=Winogradskyella sp. TaxID=1883156 RepID=UPI003F6BFE4D
MTLCMSAIIGIGFLIKYTLISGQERWELYGSNVELYLFGMDRHQWGMLHLILGFVLFGLLAVHIYLHWNVVTTVYQRMIKQPLTKKIVALCFGIICTSLIIIPFFINPDIEPSKKGRAHKVTLVTQFKFG